MEIDSSSQEFPMDHHNDSPTLSSPPPDIDVNVTNCFGCQQPITDEFRLRVAPDMEWHAGCLTCSECKIQLDESCTCFIKNGKTYCKKDYIRVFGITCGACKQRIHINTDLIMRAEDQVYHMKCFACAKCGESVPPGDHFGVRDGKLYCKSDYNSLQQQESDSASVDSGGDRKPQSASRPKRSNSEKGPRVRTVLSEQQLQTLRSVYASNPRPDALLKEHLVELTQLSPRVIRVWFQNKRCKDKKKMIHAAEQARQQQAMQQQQHGAAPNIPPLTPQTPLTPDSISPHHSMPAFTYPPAPPFEVLPPPTVAYSTGSYGSPTDSNSLAHFDVNVDYSSPSMTPVEPHPPHSSINTQVTPYF